MGYGSTAKYDDLLNTNQLTLDLLLDDDSVKFEVKANPRLGELYRYLFLIGISLCCVDFLFTTSMQTSVSKYPQRQKKGYISLTEYRTKKSL